MLEIQNKWLLGISIFIIIGVFLYTGIMFIVFGKWNVLLTLGVPFGIFLILMSWYITHPPKV